MFQLDRAVAAYGDDFFFYEAGGFPLARCSYRLAHAAAPEPPTPTKLQALVQHLPTIEHEQERDRLLALAEAWYPRAVDAYRRAPYKVIVRVQGDSGPHTLEYVNADRFLRQMGVLRMCANCGTWSLHLGHDDAIGLCCAYRSLD